MAQTQETTLGQIGEFGLLRDLLADLPSSPAVSVGPGDDAAVFLVSGSAVVSTDMLVEGVHFRRDWSEPREIGHKAVAVNASDIEAMGARPVAMVIGLGAPPHTPVAWVRELMVGITEEAAQANLVLVGGDTTRSADISISVTVIGETDGLAPVLRSGARPGQLVAFAGRLGWAAAGLTTLQRGFRSPRAAVMAQRMPQVPYGQGRIAAESGATAMIDISDGLRGDLGHIARASGVVIDLDTSLVPIDEPLRVVGQATGVDPLTFALGGGEDQGLVATFDPGFVPEGWTVIGEVRRVPGGMEPMVLVDGTAPEGPAGWDHFS
ncbi:thiamine-phosphate kinase [Tessaracoccus sp. SD287]|uniref:thiamine-phosphate kinase n=1 Tax=Tessaracoccus sp. SD287 TaxID=2782008 RepID=UPI001A9711F1|nr:thiamine-phosphate kinase [Tessaracoccus sp. SD287]MBO1029872.1 thiamine-phosphate kinase [Tessaracoccus sp. SD287]